MANSVIVKRGGGELGVVRGRRELDRVDAGKKEGGREKQYEVIE